jgi:hypothetical protein
MHSFFYSTFNPSAPFLLLSSKLNFLFISVPHSYLMNLQEYSLSIPTGGGLFIQNKNAKEKT